MQSGSDSVAGDKWFLLKTEIDGNPHFVGVMPSLPSKEERAAYPIKATVTVSYEANENGLPMYEDDLEALNGLEEDFRSWDPDETIFRNAMRSTGGGERKWVLYATSAEEFGDLVPESDFIMLPQRLTLAGLRFQMFSLVSAGEAQQLIQAESDSRAGLIRH